MSQDRSIRVVHVGLGQIGRLLVQRAAESGGFQSVAAIDPNPEYTGRTLTDVCGGGAAVVIRSCLAEAREDGDAEVALQAVGSHVEDIGPQIIELVEAGLHVVTTAEELVWPFDRSRALADRIDETARRCGRSVVAAGVNPGVLMDRLPAFITSLCVRVDAVRVYRLVDLSKRRPALRRKMGVGESEKSVRARIEARSIGHVGLPESLGYLASALGWNTGLVSERLDPIIADEEVVRGEERVAPGAVLGLDHEVSCEDDRGRPLGLHLVMRLDAEEPVDEIVVDGDPPLHLRFLGGVDGDVATVATVLNGARFAIDAPAGLIAKLPIPAGGW